MSDVEAPGTAQQPERQPISIILIMIGAAFLLLGLIWTREFVSNALAGRLDGFVEWRAGAYAVTYLAAGAGMLLHRPWATWASAAWAVVTVSQFVYPPAPREQVPLLAQIAVALIVLFWTVGLVFYVRRRTNPSRNSSV